jgi:chromatin remodeling complex protein RSC6
MKAMTPSSTLAAVVGSSAMPRTEVTKKIWDYIKKNKLQDSVNRRQINADDKLKAVFGGRNKVSMFEMTKLVSNHLK